jgi:two-component system cell cycle sensor histidine kinase/response regulator CckA
VVDDDQSVRGLVCRILAEQGYTILEAEDGAAGFDLALAHAGCIDLLLTDVIMPKINGITLAIRLREARPGLAVLYMSGYLESTMLLAKDSKAVMLQKPFTSDRLVAAVRRALIYP